jgi:hypothetical protein
MFEAAWESAKPAQKKRALPSVQRAVFSFFAGSPAAAAAALDGARTALRETPPTETEFPATTPSTARESFSSGTRWVRRKMGVPPALYRRLGAV